MIIPHTPFYPMEPKSFPHPFDDPSFGFQIKWDGTRILSHIDGKVELFNRKKKKRNLQYPDIVESLSGIFRKRSIILDGEIISLLNGKPSFQQLLRRDWATDEATIKSLMRRIPVTYVIFDILYLDGKELYDLPFQKRDEILKSLLSSRDPLVVTDTFLSRGTTLFQVVKERGLEGIVAKKLDSRYVIGKKSGSWLKIKNKRLIHTLVGGYLAEVRSVRSLLLGTYQEGEFIYLGRASSGLSYEESRKLFDILSDLESNSCPFSGTFHLLARENPRWVKPEVQVLVEYLDFTEEGLLRNPVIKKINF